VRSGALLPQHLEHGLQIIVAHRFILHRTYGFGEAWGQAFVFCLGAVTN
jgi:hypothetical protein